MCWRCLAVLVLAVGATGCLGLVPGAGTDSPPETAPRPEPKLEIVDRYASPFAVALERDGHTLFRHRYGPDSARELDLTEHFPGRETVNATVVVNGSTAWEATVQWYEAYRVRNEPGGSVESSELEA
jgi:hypothetical protein